ncbi:MAG TPA: hypothetical protein HA263_11985 [Methanoregulaceae archaeon]|nr:hypothetical protein [Methanoregulaceae archaeon]
MLLPACCIQSVAVVDRFTYVTKWGTYGLDYGLFAYPRGIAVDAGSTVNVSDMENHRTRTFTRNGTLITT